MSATFALFAVKVAIPPLLVAAMTLIARRFGPTVGGLILGLPWMTGPVLYFLGLEKGTAFAVAACTGIQLGTVAIAGYIGGFALGAAIGPWTVALATATVGFVAATWAIKDVAVSLPVAAALGIVALLVVRAALPAPRALPAPQVPPVWDIPARMATTAILVAGILVLAERLGPQLSGIISTFPVILTVIGAFTLQQRGRDALLAILRGIAISLIGFVFFFLVVGTLAPTQGLAVAFAMATIVGVAWSGMSIAVARRSTGRG